jgi:hypothetical protein
LLHWKQLAWLTDAELARFDVAAVNLACAAGLPGVERFDPAQILRRLDEWAWHAGRYTERVLPQFRRRPEEYGGSEAYFRVLVLVTALQRDLGLRYNPDKMSPDTPLGPADSFIHEAVLGSGGTCASIPVVVAAVGRRLGYPIKLVACLGKEWAHVFARWDGPAGERFNIEATNRGLNCDPDDYYRSGLFERTRGQEEAGGFLKSQSPREELAGFLAERAAHWRESGRLRPAAESYAHASALAPGNRFYLNTLKTTLNAWGAEQERAKPPGFPDLFVTSLGRRYPPGLPAEVERQLQGREATDGALGDPVLERLFWGPLRRGLRPARVPARLEAHPGRAGYAVDVHFPEGAAAPAAVEEASCTTPR